MVPSVEIEEGQGAISIVRPLVEAIGIFTIRARMRFMKEGLRYGALMYGIALPDLHRTTALISWNKRTFLQKTTCLGRDGNVHQRHPQPIDLNHAWFLKRAKSRIWPIYRKQPIVEAISVGCGEHKLYQIDLLLWYLQQVFVELLC